MVNFPREQAQRQANDARAMTKHSLNRIGGFSGIGRPKDRNDA
jgi:hypothetical protein